MRHHRVNVERTDRTDARSPLKLAVSAVVGAVDVGAVGAVRDPSLSPSPCECECVLALELPPEPALEPVPPSVCGRDDRAGSCDANDGGRSEYPLRCDCASESARVRGLVAYTPREPGPFVWRGTGDVLVGPVATGE